MEDEVVSPSFSYHKLPHQHFLNLSVLKLDGTSFDVQVARTASVAALKLAVEDVFSQSSKDEQAQISWSHVWGHFCLCFESQKLVNDKAYIRSYGIKDGNQLSFMRHLSLNYGPVKQYKGRNVTGEQRKSLSGWDVREEKMDKGGDHNGDNQEENRETHYFGDDKEVAEFSGRSEFKFLNFLRGLQKYSRIWTVGKTRREDKLRPSKYSGYFSRFGTKVARFSEGHKLYIKDGHNQH